MQYSSTVSKTTELSVHFQGKPFNIIVFQVYALIINAKETEVEQFYEDLQYLLELTPPKDVLFIIEDWNAKVGSQETPEVTGKFGLGIRNERTGRSKHPLPRTQEDSTHGHHQMVNTKIRLITSLQPKMVKLYTVSKSKTGS